MGFVATTVYKKVKIDKSNNFQNDCDLCLCVRMPDHLTVGDTGVVESAAEVEHSMVCCEGTGAQGKVVGPEYS